MIIEFYQQDGFNPKRKGPTEYCGPCPNCGGDDRFIIKTTGNGARYFCRQCQIKGDSIQYLREFRSMTYRQAAELVGKEVSSLPGKRNSHRAPATPHKSAREAFTPLPELWAANAEELTVKANSNLLGDQVILDWLLKERGITRQTAERFRLGWIYQDRYADRAAWGVPEKLGDDGRAMKMPIPAGLVIPGPDRLRIRRVKPWNGNRYHVFPGSGSAPMIINGHLGADIAAAIVVESELDGILLCQELKTRNVIVATGSTANGPSEELIADLRRRPFVLVALDNDPAGGRASSEKWLATLRNAWRAPVPPSWGKDHTEAYLSGHDLNLWFSAGCMIVTNNSID